MPTTRQPIVRRSAWRPSDFSSKDDFSVTLNEQHVVAFDRALAANRAATRETESISREDFALDDIADDVAAWRDEVLNGRGFVVLRGFPLQRYTEDEIATIYWGLGTYVGRAVSQSNLGDYIGHVIDVGGKDRRERPQRSWTVPESWRSMRGSFFRISSPARRSLSTGRVTQWSTYWSGPRGPPHTWRWPRRRRHRRRR